MPIHDWTRVDAGLFHHFHQSWLTELCAGLNSGVLPPDFFALIGQRTQEPIPDFVVSDLAGHLAEPGESEVYACKADRITVRHRHGDVVAVIEIVSPGNKGSRAELRAFVEKAADLIRQGIHLLVIDLFPPGRRDPKGIHKAVWDEFLEEDLELPADKPFTLASYDAGPARVAYVKFVGVGDALPDMPLFLKPEIYVPAPLEATYQATWDVFPVALRGLLE